MSRDAEITLLNCQALLERHKADFEVLAPQDIVTVEIDLLLHYLNHGSRLLSMSSAKTDNQAKKLADILTSKQIGQVIQQQNPDTTAFAYMLIAMAKFTTLGKEVPYLEIKNGLKKALLMLCGTGNQGVLMPDDDP